MNSYLSIDDFDILSSPIVARMDSEREPDFDLNTIRTPGFDLLFFDDFPMSQPAQPFPVTMPCTLVPQVTVTVKPAFSRKRNPAIFHPFVSFHDLEITVKALQNTFSRTAVSARPARD
jgi:hypothetical protein